MDNKILLTVLTPSYNREKELSRLYDSLKKQTCQKFEWMVVDDGSMDKTEETVRQWEKEGRKASYQLHQKRKRRQAYSAEYRNFKNKFGAYFYCGQ